MFAYFVALIYVVGLSQDVNGHGRLINPASRASMWRYGFSNPPDYNDNQGFCGGREYQMSHGGKCGICGDPYGASPKEHEAPGGRFANGIISATYQSGAEIDVTIQITANHKGYFVFKLCPNNDVTQDPDQSCFDNNVLQVLNGDGTKFFIGTYNGNYNAKLKLPDGLTCSQCILQWDYTTGNHWGTDPITGQGGIGVNPLEQEHFRACADITITGDGGAPPSQPPTTSAPEPTSTSSAAPEPTTTTSSAPPQPPTTAPTTTNPPETTTTASEGDCKAVGAWAGNAAMDQWCEDNCNHVPPFCPESHCNCDGDYEEPVQKQCHGVGPWADHVGIDQWCNDNCNHNPPFCPQSHCSCDE